MDSKNAETKDKLTNDDLSDSVSESEESYYNPYRGQAILEGFVFLSVENVVWKLVICASCFIIHVVQLYDMFFWNLLKVEKSWEAIRWTCDFVYLVDVASAVLHRKLTNIRARSDQKPRKLALIVLDLVSLVPIDFIFGISERVYTDDLYAVTFIQRSLRINRIIIYLREMNNAMAVGDGIVLCHKYVMLIFLAMHTLACLWHCLASWNTRNWFTDLAMIDFYQDRPFERYLVCTYYISSAMTGVGLGDIVPVNNSERFLTIITLATGQVIIVGLFVGSWSTLLEDKNRRYFEFRYRVGLMNHEMKSRSVPERLKSRVLAFYASFWKRCHAVVNSALFERLPLAMIREVNLDIYWKAINSLSLLQDLHISEKREISFVMTTQHFMPGDFIFRQGDLKHSMIYISEGIVQVYVKGIDCPAISLSAGSCIGGGVGLLLGGRRYTTLQALTCCNLHVLSRSNYFHICSKFPRIAQKMREKFQREFKLIQFKIARSIKYRSKRLSQDQFYRFTQDN